MIVWSSDVRERDSLLSLLPIRIMRLIDGIENENIIEVRIRNLMPIRVKTQKGKFFVSKYSKLIDNINEAVYAKKSDISDALEILTCNSLYSVEYEINQGYITASGGLRVGIVGSTVFFGDKISSVNNITGLNYRFPHEIKGAANAVFRDVYNGGRLRSTLIISPPGMGKTTILRDLIRQTSNKGINVGVVDERCEISAMSDGQASFDLGFDTDVLDNCKKTVGMNMLVRSMSPEVVAVDEIGTIGDVISVRDAMKCGIKVFATVHGEDRKSLLLDNRMKNLVNMFECVVTLGDNPHVGSIKEVNIE